jgi:hypothetical protein
VSASAAAKRIFGVGGASDTIIENAVGGSGSDHIYGNQASNELRSSRKICNSRSCPPRSPRRVDRHTHRRR